MGILMEAVIKPVSAAWGKRTKTGFFEQDGRNAFD
jgi:hypothetical protein